MSKALKKISKKHLKLIQDKCAKHGSEELRVGDMFFYREGEDVIRINRLEKTTHFAFKEYDLSDDPKKKKKDFETDSIRVHYSDTQNWECTEFRDSYGSDDIDLFIKNYAHNKITKPIAEYLEEADKVIAGKKSMAEYKDENTIDDHALIHVGSKEHLTSLKDSMLEKKKHVDLIRQAVQFKLEQKKRELEKFRDNLALIVQDFKEKVAKIQRVIYTIELYLGINEDVVQIQQGPKAPVGEVIILRQEVLCMDEEVGDPMDDGQGLDFRKIETFDDWLLKYSDFYGKYNYEILIPEPKGIVCLRVRREDKDYGGDALTNAQINVENHKTYVLIRNGQSIYRIWGNIRIWPRLFPYRLELQDLKDRWDDIESAIKDDDLQRLKKDDDYGHVWEHDVEKEQKEIDDQAFRYKQQILMLQGLMDRTEIFQPLPERIDLLDSKVQDKGLVKLIYDNELKLPDLKKPFWQWIDDINNELETGSRILFIGELKVDGGKGYIGTHAPRSRLDKRFNKSWRDDSDWSSINMPINGVYILKKYKTEETVDIKTEYKNWGEVPEHVREHYYADGFKKQKNFKLADYDKENGYQITKKKIIDYLAIFYNPGDEVRNWWDVYDHGHERKNCISYKIYKDDLNIINYDAVSLEDVEYYLHSRINRRLSSREGKGYQRMMPILNEIRLVRLKEKEWEAGFIEMLKGELTKKGISEDKSKKDIDGAIQWWKLKNKWKRGLNDNDEKALRMIKKRLKIK